MTTGLRESDMHIIQQALASFAEIEEAILFGSRATQTYKPGSDVDIAIYGEHVNMDVVSKLHAQLEELSPLPYMFDIVDGTHLNHDELQEHIQRIGKIIYTKQV